MDLTPSDDAQTVLPADPREGLPPARRRWRQVATGAVAGGVLAASLAVPVTWSVVRSEAGTSSASSSSSSAAGGSSGTVSDPGTGTLPGTGFGWSGPESGTDGSTTTGAAAGTAATADESTGVVLIDTETTSGAAAGTGLVLDSSGLVVTNYHVVEGSTSVQVTVATTGDAYDATVLGFDQDADVALLQLS